MPRKPLPGPSQLSKILENLNRTPKPVLNKLKALNLSMAARNDHFGARHFMKEELPRIRYVNPDLKIQVTRKPKTREEQMKAEMELQFHDGTVQTVDVSEKWSTVILDELMDVGSARSRRSKPDEALASNSASGASPPS